MDVVKDYGCEILSHPGKANLVADALSQKTTSNPMKGVCLRMKLITSILDLIKEA